MITENGVALPDVVSRDGKVHDSYRTDFIERYVAQLQKARSEGTDIRGYFYWSLMDNFEWRLGFSRRFGLIFVDYPTQKRIPKDSFFFYKSMIEKINSEQ